MMWQRWTCLALRRIARQDTTTPNISSTLYCSSHRAFTDRLTRLTINAVAKTPAAPAVQSPTDTLSSLPAWHNTHEVTSHVGELGTMSRRAIALRKEDHEQLGTNTNSNEEEMMSEEERAAAAASRRRREQLLQQMRAHNDPLTLLTHSPNSDTAIIDPIDEPNNHHSHEHNHDHYEHVERTQSSSRRYSGVQLEILGLFHQLLREVARMEDATTRDNLQRYIRAEFDKHALLSRRDIAQIEWQVNYAKRKLEDLRGMSPTTRFTVKL